MKKIERKIISPLTGKLAPVLLIVTVAACSSTMNLPGKRIAETPLVYFIPLEKKPYMIYLTAQEPKERSRSFSLADSVTATGTLLYPATIEKINAHAFATYKKILGDRLAMVPDLKVKRRTILGTSTGYNYNNFKADFFIRLSFKKKNRQVKASYTIRGFDFLKEALPVFPDGSPLVIRMYMRNRENRKFTKVYNRELYLFNRAPEEKSSLAPLNEAFVWHIAYASGEKEMRFDFMKHVTILRAAVLERTAAFVETSGEELAKAMP